MRKLLAIVLISVLLFSSLGIPAFAVENDKIQATVGPWDGFYWMTGGPMLIISTDNDEYLIYGRKGWSESVPIETYNGELEGVTYDKEKNTLTLDNVKMPQASLAAHYMGDDLKIRVIGECELGYLCAMNHMGYHSTSLNITGTGTLTINKNKLNDEAVYMYSDSDCLMHFDVAPTVTLNMYAKENATDAVPQNVMRIWSTYADPAISEGGTALSKAKFKHRVETVTESADVVWLDDPDREFELGKRIRSKSDPDGFYTEKDVQSYVDGKFVDRCLITKYVFSSVFNTYIPDPEYINAYGDEGIVITQEEFDAGYEYITEPQPKKIRYTSEYREKNRGYRGVMFKKDDDAEGVYIGTNGWSISYTSTTDALSETDGNIYIYKAHWDDEEQLYVTEGSYVTRDSMEALTAEGFSMVEENGKRVEVQYIDKNYGYDDYSTQAFLLTKENSTGSYCAEVLTKPDGSKQYFVDDIYWDDEKGHYYSPHSPGQLYIGDPPYDSIGEMEAEGYRFVLEDQPSVYKTKGKVRFSAGRDLYKDSQGKRYFLGNWDGEKSPVYTFSENDTLSYGGKTFCIGSPVQGLSEDDLTPITYDRTRDDFTWWIPGTEYHHKAQAAQSYLLGDADSDGGVTISDVSVIQMHLAMLNVPVFNEKAADSDRSGGITIIDATVIQQYLAKIENGYPVGEWMA